MGNTASCAQPPVPRGTRDQNSGGYIAKVAPLEQRMTTQSGAEDSLGVVTVSNPRLVDPCAI